jgi:hypothetical protein
MTYLKVEWLHDFDDEPIEILSELDSRRREIRKVERFRDGTLTFAGSEGTSGSTMLSEAPLPPLKEIASDPQFRPQTIGKEAFEHRWKAATMSVAA